MSHRPLPQARDAYPHFAAITTRWMDNDAYGHVNNVVDIQHSGVIGLVIETHCNYFAPLEFPQTIDAGLRVAHVGRSSVRYEVGLFAAGAQHSAAAGHFVHVYVDRASRRPVALPAALLAALKPLQTRA